MNTPHAQNSSMFRWFLLIVLCGMIGFIALVDHWPTFKLSLLPDTREDTSLYTRDIGEQQQPKELPDTREESEHISLYTPDHEEQPPDKLPTNSTALSELYECVGWHATTNCDPNGELINASLVRTCSTLIPGKQSGYCELRHRVTGATHRVLQLHCDSIKFDLNKLKCEDYAKYFGYGERALSYRHNPPFSIHQNRKRLVQENPMVSSLNDSGGEHTFFQQGIVISTYHRILPSTYANVRQLRDVNCTLPIELWYRKGELDPSNPLVSKLCANYGVFLRLIDDPNATGYFTKLHAVYYSAFDHVLLLDADNFAVKDPSYLFKTDAFTEHGALFWPDRRRPSRRGYWDVIDNSLLWELMGINFVDMFEQESGQVVIDRVRHVTALDVLMYLGFHMPRVLDDLKLVWGDKDLFRLSWLRTNSSFFWSPRPCGSIGKMHRATGEFCGGSMVQYDPNGDIIFLHHTPYKPGNGPNDLWGYVQSFRTDLSLSNYTVTSSRAGSHFPDLNDCYGEKDKKVYDHLYTMTAVGDLPAVARLRDKIRQFVLEGRELSRETHPL